MPAQLQIPAIMTLYTESPQEDRYRTWMLQDMSVRIWIGGLWDIDEMMKWFGARSFLVVHAFDIGLLG